MTTSLHRRSSRRLIVALVAFAVLGANWSAHATVLTQDKRCGFGGCGRQQMTAFGLRYVPEREKNIGYGDTLDFVNADPMTAGRPGHTVTHLNKFGPPRFDTGVVAPGGVATVAGAEDLTPGRYIVFCKVHPHMRGKIHVVAGGIDVPIVP